MLSIFLFTALTVLGVTFAQTPLGFSPSTGTNLHVSYGGVDVLPPGIFFSIEEVAYAPLVGRPTTVPDNANDSYVLIMMDIDVPLNGGTTLLHWLRWPVTPDPTNGQLTIPVDNTSGAPYFGPAPPSGQTHRYVELLFKQPTAEFHVPSDFQSFSPPANVTARIGFDLNKFVQEAGLTDLVAANFFRVQNGTTSASGTSSGGASSTTAAGASDTGASSASGSGSGSGSSQTTSVSSTGSSETAGGTASATRSATTGAGVIASVVNGMLMVVAVGFASAMAIAI